MAADEIIKAYDRDQKVVGKGKRRDLLHRMREEHQAGNDSPFAVQVIHLLLYKPKTGLYIVQRAKSKDENPGRWCKTVGGHVLAGENPEEALLRETQEEAGITLLVCDKDDYPGILQKADLRKSGVVFKVSELPWFESTRYDRHGRAWRKTMQSHVYLGAFDGRLRLDQHRRNELVKETNQWCIMSIDSILRNGKESPADYTPDLLNLTLFYRDFLTQHCDLPGGAQ